MPYAPLHALENLPEQLVDHPPTAVPAERVTFESFGHGGEVPGEDDQDERLDIEHRSVDGDCVPGGGATLEAEPHMVLAGPTLGRSE